MSQAEELLATLTDDVSVHTHSVTDSDTYFVIDPITHEIENTARKKRVLMQHDHRSERFTFELPRYVEGHDMTLCDRVRVHYNNVGTKTGAEEEEVEERADVVELTDLRINPDDTETVICSWLIERQSTQLVGILSFLVQYLCTDNGEVVYEWHSDIFEDVEIRKGRNNGEAAVIEYSNILEQWYTRIFGAGDSVMASIASESATQLTAIQAESVKQQSAIESKGAATLATIPEDYTETYNMAVEAIRTKANAIECEAEGESIILEDSSDDYVRGLKIFGKSTQFATTGKNLMIQPYVETLLINNNVTFTINDDYSVKINVTSDGALANTAFRLFGVGITDTQVLPTGVVSGEKYTLSAGGVLPTGMSMAVYFYDSDQTAISSVLLHEAASVTFTIPANTVSWYGYIRIAEGAVVSNTTVYPMIELGSVATDYEPYTGGIASPNPAYPQEIVSINTPTVIFSGKNLLDISQALNENFTENNGVYTITRNDGGGRFSETVSIYIPANTPFKVSVKDITATNSSARLPIYFKGANGSTYYASVTSEYTCIYEETITSMGLYLASSETVGSYVSFSGMQIEIGRVATDYEPYKEQQSVSISHTLPGIPVSSGGNYTDENGQQWICDEVDFERGVYVQRIKVLTANGTGTAVYKSANGDDNYLYHFGLGSTYAVGNGACFCNKLMRKTTSELQTTGKTVDLLGISPSPKYNVIYFNLGYYLTENTIEAVNAYLAENPLVIYYAITTPIETPLTAEELEAFKVLHTNYPNTTILNDQSAHMKLSYNADTKTYVDNKIAEAVAQYLATA